MNNEDYLALVSTNRGKLTAYLDRCDLRRARLMKVCESLPPILSVLMFIFVVGYPIYNVRVVRAHEAKQAAVEKKKHIEAAEVARAFEEIREQAWVLALKRVKAKSVCKNCHTCLVTFSKVEEEYEWILQQRYSMVPDVLPVRAGTLFHKYFG